MKQHGASEADETAPIVIVGGFLSFSMLYYDMRNALSRITERPVSIVETQSLDWMATVARPGWTVILRKIDRAVSRALETSGAKRVTLIGHSAGGVLARLYLSPRPFLGRTYSGLERVDHLITLGSPHHNRRKWLHGGLMSRWIEARYPGAFFTPEVRYTSVAGQLIQGDQRGSLAQRHAFSFYAETIGDGAVWGDGLVPVASALLEGSRQIVLEGVSHFTGFGGPWYGAADVIPRWWDD
jgi:pimeloyl-ACP methyl ester carboxylesterase